MRRMLVTADTSQPPMGASKVEALWNADSMSVTCDTSQAPMSASKAAALLNA